jgi:hypothetical protein
MPFQLVEASNVLVAPAFDARAALGREFLAEAIKDIDPVKDGLALIEAQRALRGGPTVGVDFSIAGGFAEMVTVFKEGAARHRLRD